MKRKLLVLLFTFSLGLYLLPMSSMAYQDGTIGPNLKSELARAGSSEKIPVIIRMKERVAIKPLTNPSHQKGPIRTQARAKQIHTLKARAEQSRKPLQKLLDRHGITKSRQLWLINGMALQATPAQIEDISKMLEVASVAFDQSIEVPKISPLQVSGPAEPNIDQVHAPDLWTLGYAGQGVTVAIMDSGVDIDHPDLESRWRGGTNSWFDPNAEHPLVPTDLEGHGTQVTGLVLGGNYSGSYIGVAPDAQWIGVKIFADNGLASLSRIHDGFQWLLDPDGNPKTDDAPDIVNNSWGFEFASNVCDDFSKEFQPDVQTLKAAGIAVVFAAGNTVSSISPANYPASFAVGSVGSASLLSYFSASGPSACDSTIYPEMVAPGENVLTSDLTSNMANIAPYISVTGTSFSTPHASGVMALLLSAFPSLSVHDLEMALMQSGTDFGVKGADNDYGYGLINALAAFNHLDGLQDSDGDGVANGIDLCPATPTGSLVGIVGCNGQQLIDYRCASDGLKNHGQFVSCVSKAANEAEELGLIEKEGKGKIVSQMAKKK